ncbi:hypothetical protein SAMN04488039_103294 [Sulfitobacter dubius]|nr:hypothetical protein SAMN04488039_103294 [Sulfitobacter dubius]
MLLKFHFPEYTFPLKLLLQNTKGLIDVVIANTNLHGILVIVARQIHTGLPNQLFYQLFHSPSSLRMGYNRERELKQPNDC